MASDLGVGVKENAFSNTAKDILSDINESPRLKDHTSPALVKALENYSDGQESSLKSANIFRGKLGEEANKSHIAGDKFEAGIYGKLKESLTSDIGQSIVDSGNADLKSSYDKAQQFYKDKIAPFEDKDIVKFTRKGGDPDTILQAFIKPSRFTDRSHLINKLVEKLPDGQKTLPIYGWLSNAVDESGRLNPSKFRTMWNKLGDEQKNILVPDEKMRNRLSDYSSLVSKNQKALYRMHNPPTGQQASDILPYIISGMLHGGGAMAGHALGGVPGAIGGALGAGLATRPMVSALTSPALRKMLVKTLGAKQRVGGSIPRTGLRPSTGALMALSQNQSGGQ